MSPLFSCANSYMNGRKVSKAYFNGTDLCQDAFSTPGLIPPGAVGTAIFEIDTRLYRRKPELSFGLGTVDPTNRRFAFAIQSYSTQDIASGKPAIVIDWGDGTVFTGTSRGVDTRGSTIGQSGDNIFDHTYPSPGLYTVTISNLSINGCSFSLGSFAFQPSATQYKECIKTVRFNNDTWRFSGGTKSNSLFGNCNNLTSFTAPTIDPIGEAFRPGSGPEAGTFPITNPFENISSFDTAFLNCRDLTSFPYINTFNVSQFIATWSGCTSLSNFPNNLDFGRSLFLLNTFSGNAFTSWDCDGQITAINLRNCWLNCSNLVNFPSGKFNGPRRAAIYDSFGNVTRRFKYSTNAFDGTFKNCALSSQSIENILTDLVTGGETDIVLSLEGGTNAGASTWTANAISAYNTLISRGWSITRNA